MVEDKQEILDMFRDLVEERDPSDVEHPMRLERQIEKGFPNHEEYDTVNGFMDGIEADRELTGDIDTIDYGRAWRVIGEHFRDNEELYNDNPLHWSSIIGDASVQVTMSSDFYFEPLLLETYMAVPKEESNENWIYGPSGLSNTLSAPEDIIDDFISDMGQEEVEKSGKEIRRVGILTNDPETMAAIVNQRLDRLEEEGTNYSDTFRKIYDETVEFAVNHYKA